MCCLELCIIVGDIYYFSVKLSDIILLGRVLNFLFEVTAIKRLKVEGRRVWNPGIFKSYSLTVLHSVYLLKSYF